MKSVEMWPFVRTKHACSCAKEYQRCVQWPQRWCNVNEQSLLKMQKVTSLLQKGKGIPDFVTCKSTELLRPWGSQVYEPSGSSSPVWPGCFQDLTCHMLHCADSSSDGCVSGIPPSLIWEVCKMKSCSKAMLETHTWASSWSFSPA